MRIDLLVNDFTYRAVHDRFIVLFESTFKRNYIHVRDVSLAFRHGLNNFTNMSSNVYNVGLSDANVSKLELCQVIQQHIPDFVVIEEKFRTDPDQRNYLVSNAKIESTGFLPEHGLSEGVSELIKGYATLTNRKYGNI